MPRSEPDEAKADSEYLNLLGEALLLRESGAFDPRSFREQYPAHADRVLEELRVLEHLDGLEGEPPSPEATDAGIRGQRIAQYRLLEPLGRGGQGSVFLAEDTRLGRMVALKILPRGLHQSSSARLRFAREAQVASTLRHPGLCTIYEVGEAEEMPFIAMELVEGEPLSRKVSSAITTRKTDPTVTCVDVEPADPAKTDVPPGRRRDVTRIVRLVEGTARALHAAHEAGLVHRDMKPGNVMVTPDGRPVIVDFGLARAAETTGPVLTHTGDVMGTPAYMAPEQIDSGRGAVDRRADIFALGVVLFESLTLRRPFEAPTREGLYRAILTQDHPNPRSLSPAIPRDLVAILQTTLQKDPDRRYQTAEALSDDLSALAEGRPVSVKPLSALGRITRWARRRPVAAALACTILIAVGLAGFLAAKWKDLGRASEARQRERVERFLERGFSELGGGPSAKAVVHFRSAIEASAIAPLEAVAGLVYAHLWMRDPKTALSVLDRYMPRDDGTLARIRLEVLNAAGLESEARELERKVKQPRTAVDFFFLGLEAFRRGNLGERAAFGEALEHFTEAIFRSDVARPLYFFKRAQAAAEYDDEKAARSAASLLTAKWGDRAAAWFWAGVALAKTDRDRAIDCWQKAIELGPNGKIHANLGNLLSEQGRHAEAVAALFAAVELEPDFYNYSALAAALVRKGALEDALPVFRKAVAAVPATTEYQYNRHQHFAVHFNLGIALERLGRLDEAVDAYRQAVAVREDDLGVRVGLAGALAKKGALEDALAACDQALALKPDDARIYAILGMIGNACFGRKNFDGAIAAFERSAAVRPEITDAHSALAVAYERKGLLDKARTSAEEAIRLGSKVATPYFVLGRALQKKGDHKRAIRALRRAAAIDPQHWRALNALGICLGLTGDSEEAVEAFRRTTALRPDFPGAWVNLIQTLAAARRSFDALVAVRQAFEALPRADLAAVYAPALIPRCRKAVLRQALNAARRGFGLAEDSDGLADEEQAELRKEAASWLRELVGGWHAGLDRGAERPDAVWKMVNGVQERLRPIREQETPERIPEEERQAWTEVWAEWDRLTERVKP